MSDYSTHTEADAGRYDRAHHAEPDDRPSPSDLASPGLDGRSLDGLDSATEDAIINAAYYDGPDVCEVGGIKCGSCKAKHPNVSDIRWCYDLKREAMAEAQAEQAAEAASERAFDRDREAIAERGTWFGPQTIADTWGEGLDTPQEPPF